MASWSASTMAGSSTARASVSRSHSCLRAPRSRGTRARATMRCGTRRGWCGCGCRRQARRTRRSCRGSSRTRRRGSRTCPRCTSSPTTTPSCWRTSWTRRTCPSRTTAPTRRPSGRTCSRWPSRSPSAPPGASPATGGASARRTSATCSASRCPACSPTRSSSWTRTAGAGEVDAARLVRVHGEVAAAEGGAELVLPPERVQGVRAGHGVPIVAERGAAPGEGAHQGALPQPPLLGHLGGRLPAVDGQGRPRHALLLRPQHHVAAARAGRRRDLRVIPGQGRLRHAARAQPDQQVLPARRALQGVQG
uniref:Uncharacterized protein n=1 Tax=Triticum urartu TaxID=4572 RepID=A0A8R7U182_TRIUA